MIPAESGGPSEESPRVIGKKLDEDPYTFILPRETVPANCGAVAATLRTTRAEALAFIRDARRKLPGLGQYGNFGDGKPENDPKRLLEDSFVQDVRRVADWMATLKRTSKFTDDSGSYRLKHFAENAIGGYVPNGAVIVAGLGLKIPCSIDSPNCRFKVRAKGNIYG